MTFFEGVTPGFCPLLINLKRTWPIKKHKSINQSATTRGGTGGDHRPLLSPHLT